MVVLVLLLGLTAGNAAQEFQLDVVSVRASGGDTVGESAADGACLSHRSDRNANACDRIFPISFEVRKPS